MKSVVVKILGENWLVSPDGWQKVADDYVLPEHAQTNVVTVPKVLNVTVKGS